MKVCEYWRSMSFLYHIFSRFCMFCALLGQDIRWAFTWPLVHWFSFIYVSLFHVNCLSSRVKTLSIMTKYCTDSVEPKWKQSEIALTALVGTMICPEWFKLLRHGNAAIGLPWHQQRQDDSRNGSESCIIDVSILNHIISCWMLVRWDDFKCLSCWNDARAF